MKEFIYDRAPFSAAHASTVVELRNGDVMAAWFGGTQEGAPDVAIWGSTRNDRGWSPPLELARENEIATFNPVLFHTKDRSLRQDLVSGGAYAGGSIWAHPHQTFGS